MSKSTLFTPVSPPPTLADIIAFIDTIRSNLATHHKEDGSKTDKIPNATTGLSLHLVRIRTLIDEFPRSLQPYAMHIPHIKANLARKPKTTAGVSHSRTPLLTAEIKSNPNTLKKEIVLLGELNNWLSVWSNCIDNTARIEIEKQIKLIVLQLATSSNADIKSLTEGMAKFFQELFKACAEEIKKYEDKYFPPIARLSLLVPEAKSTPTEEPVPEIPPTRSELVKILNKLKDKLNQADWLKPKSHPAEKLRI